MHVVGGALTIDSLETIDGVTAVSLDLVDPSGSARLVHEAVDRHGRIDVLVNNVGGVKLRLNGFLEISDDDHFGIPYLRHSPIPRYMFSVLLELGYTGRIEVVQPQAYGQASRLGRQSVSSGWSAGSPEPSSFFESLTCSSFIPRDLRKPNFGEFWDPPTIDAPRSPRQGR
jgi:NAD(P)-dependent dehydrogenase (short-subunit alcohol dehydrogenase family)